MFTRFAPFACAVLLLSSCDYVNEPIPPGGSGGGNGGNGPVTRRVLLEEFTGHRCNTCPAAHIVAAQLEALYGAELVIVGIHATSTFAAPLNPPAPDGRYSTDFRTPAGNTYTSTFAVSFLPTGMVSRKEYNASITIGQGSWGSAISEILGQAAQFDVWFDDLAHSGSANTVSATVKVAVLEPVTGDHNLTIYVTEDHVIDWQLNNQATPPDIPDYDHRHVLRGNVNGTWGSPLVSGSANMGDTLTLNVVDFPVNAGWNADNCALVAYVYNTASYEVMQVVERKFHP